MPINTENIDDQNLFSKHFWGENIQDGIKIILDRLLLGETTTKNIIKFMDQFEKIEEEYSNGLKSLSTIRIYKDEYPSVKRALNEVIEQIISMSKAHAKFCSEIKILVSKRLKDCLSKEQAVRREQKEVVFNQIQSTLKAYKRVSKSKETYFNNCKIKETLLSQKPPPMSKSFDAYEEKLQKIMNTSQEDEQIYIEAVRYARVEYDIWIDAMKTACNESQQIEQDRIETISTAMKNLAIGICNSRTSDISSSQVIQQVMVCDSENENGIIRCNQDFISFCRTQGTGRIVPEPPAYINYYTMSPMMIPALSSSKSLKSRSILSNSECSIQPPPLPGIHAIDSNDNMNRLFSVRALYGYKSRQSEELDLIKGQVLVVTSLREDPWWIGYEESNPEKIGVFPSNYVSKIVSEKDE